MNKDEAVDIAFFRAKRKEKGISLDQAAQEMGIDKSYLSRIENKQRSIPLAVERYALERLGIFVKQNQKGRLLDRVSRVKKLLFQLKEDINVVNLMVDSSEDLKMRVAFKVICTKIDQISKELI